MGRLLDGSLELYFAVVRVTHHADVAIAPGLLGDPFDQVIAVSAFLGGVSPGVLALRMSGASRIGDDVDIAPGDDFRGIAGFQVAVPDGALIERLRWQIQSCSIFAVAGHGQQSGKLAFDIRTKDIDRQADAITHGTKTSLSSLIPYWG